MIFAQLNPPAEIAAWLACAAFVLMMLNQGAKLKTNLSGSANRRTVDFAEVPASKVEFDKAMDDNRKVHDQLFANVSGKERGLRDEFSKELRTFRDELGKTSNTMHELKGEIKQLSIQLVTVQQELQQT